MAALHRCWLIVDYVLIPPGIRKWYCLGVFIHPVMLLCCEFYLFGVSIVCWSTFLLFYPYKAVWYLALGGFRLLRRGLWQLIVIAELDDESIRRLYSEARPARWYKYPGLDEEEEEDLSQSVVRYNFTSVFPAPKRTAAVFEASTKVFRAKEGTETGGIGEQEFHSATTQRRREVNKNYREKEEGEEEEEHWQEAHSTAEEDLEAESDEEFVSHSDEDHEIENSSLPANSTQLIVSEIRNQMIQEHADEFYENYMRKMQWFDTLIMEKLHIVGLFVQKNAKDRNFIDNLNSYMLRIGNRHGEPGKQIARSIERDFELVYVAQTCLCWEALHHYYRAVEALVPFLSDHRIIFHRSVANRLQHFHRQLERFTENELRNEKRFLNYIKQRHREQNFLQVPEIAGYVDDTDNGHYEDIIRRTEEVLRNIENAIRAFQVYLEADNCKSQKRLSCFFPINPQVENPNDLMLHDSLGKEVCKMKRRLKNLQSRQAKEHWLKNNTMAYGDMQQKEVLLSVIHINLVSRVLKMSPISTPQLKWCEEKSHCVQIRNGRVLRMRNSGESSFPYS